MISIFFESKSKNCNKVIDYKLRRYSSKLIGVGMGDKTRSLLHSY